MPSRCARHFSWRRGPGRGSYWMKQKQEGDSRCYKSMRPSCAPAIEGSNITRAERPKTRPSALRHGAWSRAAVLPWEDARQFDRLCRDLIEEWCPTGPAEEDAVFTLAKCMWRKHHTRRADLESSTPMGWWLPNELGFDERLDG